MLLLVHVHVRPGFGMIDTIAGGVGSVKKGLIGSNRSIIGAIPLRQWLLR